MSLCPYLVEILQTWGDVKGKRPIAATTKQLFFVVETLPEALLSFVTFTTKDFTITRRALCIVYGWGMV